jgi:hypothetical protein
LPGSIVICQRLPAWKVALQVKVNRKVRDIMWAWLGKFLLGKVLWSVLQAVFKKK